jgi:hypothetical protein
MFPIGRRLPCQLYRPLFVMQFSLRYAIGFMFDWFALTKLIRGYGGTVYSVFVALDHCFDLYHFVPS